MNIKELPLQGRGKNLIQYTDCACLLCFNLAEPIYNNPRVKLKSEKIYFFREKKKKFISWRKKVINIFILSRHLDYIYFFLFVIFFTILVKFKKLQYPRVKIESVFLEFSFSICCLITKEN